MAGYLSGAANRESGIGNRPGGTAASGRPSPSSPARGAPRRQCGAVIRRFLRHPPDRSSDRLGRAGPYTFGPFTLKPPAPANGNQCRLPRWLSCWLQSRSLPPVPGSRQLPPVPGSRQLPPESVRSSPRGLISRTRASTLDGYTALTVRSRTRVYRVTAHAAARLPASDHYLRYSRAPA
ncbi:MAG: hypothetical protein K0S86_2998 [Geminicoccaceae bacterium]|nr:hypothetical protein [Geminicoccaceae bacterium]